MNDTERIAKIRARCTAATPGPWVQCEHTEYLGGGYAETAFFVRKGEELLKIGTAMDGETRAKFYLDMHFIAHAREDVPWLLSEIDRLTDELDQKAKELERLTAEGSSPAIESVECGKGMTK